MADDVRVPLRNVSPLGAIELPLIGRTLEPGEEFEVTPEQAKALLDQTGNYEAVSAAQKNEKG